MALGYEQPNQAAESEITRPLPRIPANMLVKGASGEGLARLTNGDFPELIVTNLAQGWVRAQAKRPGVHAVDGRLVVCVILALP